MKNAGALVATLALIGAAHPMAPSAAGVPATAPAYVSPLQKAAAPADIATGPSGAQAVLWDSYYREPSSVLGVQVRAGIARRAGRQEPWAAEILDPAARGAKDVTVGPDGTTTAAWISEQPRVEGTRPAERSELRVAQAPPGGAFGPAHSLGDGSKTLSLHIAALRDGRTVVVWLRRDVRAGAMSAAVHSPATGWTAPQTLSPAGFGAKIAGGFPTLSLLTSVSGRAVVVFNGDRGAFAAELGPPGTAAFLPTQRLAEGPTAVKSAIAPDGGVVVAWRTRRSLYARTLDPGSTRWSPRARLGRTLYRRVAVAMGDGGRAAAAWGTRGGVAVTLRPRRGGRLGPARRMIRESDWYSFDLARTESGDLAFVGEVPTTAGELDGSCILAALLPARRLRFMSMRAVRCQRPARIPFSLDPKLHEGRGGLWLTWTAGSRVRPRYEVSHLSNRSARFSRTRPLPLRGASWPIFDATAGLWMVEERRGRIVSYGPLTQRGLVGLPRVQSQTGLRSSAAAPRVAPHSSGGAG